MQRAGGRGSEAPAIGRCCSSGRMACVHRHRPNWHRLAVAVVPVAVLLFTAFAALLRLDAQRGHRSGLQALHTDLLAGFQAVAVAAVFDAAQRFVDLADQLALAIPGAQFEAEFLFLGGPVIRVGEVGRPRPSCARRCGPLPASGPASSSARILRKWSSCSLLMYCSPRLAT